MRFGSVTGGFPRGAVRVCGCAGNGRMTRFQAVHWVENTEKKESEEPVLKFSDYSTEVFESEYTYRDADLGAVWTKEKTVFRSCNKYSVLV